MREFIYKLNAMEHASQADHPDQMGYAEKRKAVLDYVEALERDCKLAVAKLNHIDLILRQR